MWLRSLFASPRPGPSRQVRHRLSVEPLEGRSLPSGVGGFVGDPPADGGGPVVYPGPGDDPIEPVVCPYELPQEG